MVRLERMEDKHLRRTFEWLVGSPRLREQIDSLAAPTEESNVRYWHDKWQDEARENYAIVVGEQHVGNCGLWAIDKRRRKAELWIFMGEGTGHGVGRQALDALLERAFVGLELQRVSLRVVETNPRALAFYLKAGFKVEGCARADTIQNDVAIDAILLSMLSHEHGSRVTGTVPGSGT